MQPRTSRLTVCASHAPGLSRDEHREQGLAFRAGLTRARDEVDDFQPELIVMFGSDHRRTYQSVIPAMSVAMTAHGYGDNATPTGTYPIPEDLASTLLAGLLEADFDVAASYDVALDHGFGGTLQDLLDGIDVVPILPIFINCATPPLIRPSRAVELGDAVSRFLDDHCSDLRVLTLGSGGLSHAPPSLESVARVMTDSQRQELNVTGRERAIKQVSPEWDQKILTMFSDLDEQSLSQLPQELIDQGGVGANEIRTWLAAWAAGGRPCLETLGYEAVLEWITGMAVVSSGIGTPTSQQTFRNGS